MMPLLPSARSLHVYARTRGPRSFSSSSRRLATPDQPVSPHTSIYKTFGRPFLKVFLGAVFTYQVVYWGWLRLEVNEAQREKESEIRDLETKARSLAGTKTKGT